MAFVEACGEILGLLGGENFRSKRVISGLNGKVNR
jgi:hypothetical protein